MTITELLDWVVPSGVGFIVGYLTCLLVGRAVQDEDSAQPAANRRSQLARTLFGVFLVLLAGVSFTRSYLSVECTADAIRARSEAQGFETRAQIELLQAQIDADPNNNRDAIESYLRAAYQLERTRSDNPLECS